MPTGYKFDWHLPPSPVLIWQVDLPLSSPPQKAQYFTLPGVYPYLSLLIVIQPKKGIRILSISLWNGEYPFYGQDQFEMNLRWRLCHLI